MFNFMKKGNDKEEKEKEKRKKEKKENKDGKKKRERGSMTADELLRLDEVRRSLKIRGRRKEKEKLPSGITADYTENFFADLEREPEFLGHRSGSLPGHTYLRSSSPKNSEITQSDSSETSLNSLTNSLQAPHKSLPPLPPRPPKRGILKAPRPETNSLENHDPSNPNLLIRNTLQNEVITYQNVNSEMANHVYSSPEHSNSSHYLTAPHLGLQSTSPSAESLTDATSSSFTTPPFSSSPVGESQGFFGTHSHISNKNNLDLPDIVPVKLPKPRDLAIHRTARGDFGFSLRRAIITDKLSVNGLECKAVIFAEPGAIIPNNNETSLLPGDALMEVNGISVQDKSREEIIDLIKSSGSSVTVKVQPIPELSELTKRSGIDGQEIHLDDTHIKGGTLRRSGSQRFKRAAKSDEQLASEKSWLDQERLWLVHKSGYSAVRAVPNKHPSDGGKVTIQVEKTQEILEVDEDDLERANPPQLDKIEDLSQLRYLNESSVLEVLRQRYGNNLIHTYLGENLAIIHPQVTLSIYNDKVVSLFRGCKPEDMPPHIYAMAQTSYRAMLATRKDQSLLFLGRSGSGKTHNLKQTLHYLLLVAGSVNKVLTLEKLNALNTVVEAFCNARTNLNVNATRSTNVIGLDFDQSGQIASVSVQILMLDKQRVARRLDGEGSFHVFYRLLAGAEVTLAKKLSLDVISNSSNVFVTPLQKSEEKQVAALEFSRLSMALKALGVTEKECSGLWSVLGAIIHLGQSGAVQVGTKKWQFADAVSAGKACSLLGTTCADLAHTLWDTENNTSPTHGDKNMDGQETLEGFVAGLYAEVVNVICSLINRCLTTNQHTTTSLILLDAPGLQNPASCGYQYGASFTDLCYNYVQERLHLFCHNSAFVTVTDRYAQEKIDVMLDEQNIGVCSPSQLVQVLDKAPPSGVLKTSQTDLREADRRGILWMLEEETVFPNSSDETFLERVFCHYGSRDHQMYIRKAPGAGHFVVQHLLGTSPVVYATNGWLKASKETPSTRLAITVLQESNKQEISEMFITARGGYGMSSSMDGSQSLRRVSSIRRQCTVAVSRKSLGLQVKFITDGVIETVRRTRPRFVFCLLPQHNAGIGDINTSDTVVNIPLLRSQVRGMQLLSLVRVHKQGFPEFVSHGEFRRRFRLLVSHTDGSDVDDKKASEDMLLLMDLDYTSYRIGVTQVFLRAGVLALLDSQRDEKLADVVVQFQSRCRGFLARKKLAKLKIQDLAVRCIQRNVTKFMQVRDWPWWRLLIRITPLLNVHRTEEMLTAKTLELDSLKTRLEKLEQERNQLKLDNDKLETKLSEMAVDLSEERAGGSIANERLEAETSERIRLEHELSILHHEKKNLQQAAERLEMELLYARSDVNGLDKDLDADGGSGDATIYKQKCERALRELEFTKRRLHQQHEDDLEQLVALKKQLEKKLADAYEEVEEQRQVVAQWKRKVHKLQAETNDLRLLLEEQNSRNNLLEKKQRKFDSEIQMLQDELRSEKNHKERFTRERDIAVAEKYSIEQNLSSLKLELELKEEKLAALNRELEELTLGGGTEHDMSQLRKSKHDLEMKLKEQEEELDDLAGQVSILEATKLRLEMSLEQARKEHKREMAARDDELDETRANSQKKVKMIESQLETAHEERSILVREKHELERRLSEAEDRGRHSRAADEEAFLRLKRDLKKTKALLRDTQVMLDRAKQDTPSKAAFRALKNQLEDAELARASAVKAKQSLESELSDLNSQLEETLRNKHDAENKAQAALREASALRTQLDENEEELAELLKKYRQVVHQLSAEQMSHQEVVGTLAEIESERNSLKDQLAELSAKLEASSTFDPTSGIAQRRLEVKTKELEAKLDLEQTTRARLEVQISRLKENVEKLTEEAIQCRTKEQSANDVVRKLQRSVRELKEELSQQQGKAQEELHKRKDVEKRLETSEQENLSAKTDLRLALKRIEDLQSAISGDIVSDSDNSESDGDSDSDSILSHLSSPASSSRLSSRTPDFSTR